MRHSLSLAVISLLLLLVVAAAVLATPTTPVDFDYPEGSLFCLHRKPKTSGGGEYDYKVQPCVNNTNNNQHDDGVVVAKALHSFQMHRLGWDMLEISPNIGAGTTDDLRAAYFHAGFLEGYLCYDNFTQLNVTHRVHNTMNAKTKKWVEDNMAYMNASIITAAAASSATTDGNKNKKWWSRVGMILEQLRGQFEGFNAAADIRKEARATFLDVYMLSMYFDMWAVESSIADGGDDKSHNAAVVKRVPTFSGVDNFISAKQHCSGFIRKTPTDLFLAHTSWFRLTHMRRIYKTYHFDTTVRMSSYPGMVCSGDDHYVTSNGLAAIETSIGISNKSAYKKYVKPIGTVPEFARVMVANYLARSSLEWATTMANFNSGSYNNQYSILDFNKYTPGQPMQTGAGVFVLLEQMPGYVFYSDESELLERQGYFGSYNIPMSAQIRAWGGYNELEAKMGPEFYSYKDCLRAKIFRRNHSSVHTIEHVQRMIRYNGYRFDPLSIIPNCTDCHPDRSSCLSTCTRGDLAPYIDEKNKTSLGPFYDWVSQYAGAGYDGKVASWSNRHTLNVRIISGPTTDDGLPAFRFSTAPNTLWKTEGPNFVVPPVGLPDLYDFPWIESESKMSTWSSGSESDGGTNKTGVAMAVVFSVLAAIAILAVACTWPKDAERNAQEGSLQDPLA